MIIYVCIGSSCHQRSSYNVMKELKSLIGQNGLEGKVCLQPAFCLGGCGDGVTIKINDEIISGVGMSNVADLFKARVLKTCLK
ncbi:MAG: uncharacterized protein K0Q48_1004 [Bacillota bacterium]|nr:uncharacterized protein [Bacillota bacterium]